jgi:hypothetical protein
LAVLQGLEAAVLFYAAVLAYPQEDDPVNNLLDGEIKLPLGQVRIAEGDIFGQDRPPFLDLGQEDVINLGRAPLFLRCFSVLVKGTLEDGLPRENRGDILPLVQLIGVSEADRSALRRFIRL